MKQLIVPLLLVSSGAAAATPEVTLSAQLSTPVALANGTRTAYLKVGLTGFALEDAKLRAPVNIAIVIDRSSSMSGEKFERAKDAATMAIDRLSEGDSVSVVTYDSTVEVLVAATRLSGAQAEKDLIKRHIRALSPRGMTALFGGVAKGAQEVRKFLGANRVNRIILLSDGQANIGPSTPNELGRLGVSLGKDNISVTTLGLGLGYNEDLMAQLALKSDGNHAFIEDASQLARVFDAEIGDVLAVVAQEITVKVSLEGGARPIKTLVRDAEIRGNMAIVSLNQLYAKQERYFLLEVELPASAAGSSREIAKVEVAYGNMLTQKTDRLFASVGVGFAATMAEVDRRTNSDVMVAAVEAIANERSRLAVVLRDEGKVQESQNVLRDNASYLEMNAVKLKSPKLQQQSLGSTAYAEEVAKPGAWEQGARKKMRKTQHEVSTQQRY